MGEERTFLVIDYNVESRFLLVKTLRRKFPAATILEADDADHALNLVRSAAIDAIVTHRTFEVEGVELVSQLRAAAPGAMIVMVSGIERTDAAIAAGATTFLLYDEWLRIGSVVEQHLTRKPESAHPFAP